MQLMHRFASASGLLRFSVFSLLFICMLPLPARSQIFSCKDAAGITITSDHPTPECADRVIRELSNTGVLRREIPAPLTAEQKHQWHPKEENHRIAAAESDMQRQQDRALLARYRSEADIASSRLYSLSLSQDMIKHDQEWILEAEKQLKIVESETEFYKNKKIPLSVQASINDAGNVLENSKKTLRDHQLEMADINAKFDDTLIRYRHLSRNQAAATR